MIDHSRRLIFVHIQKTGGNAICTALGQPVNPPEKHFTAVQLRRLYGEEVWNAYFKFSIVRNPWDRLVSWWSMIEANRKHLEAGRRLNAFQRYVLQNANDFTDFVSNCTEIINDNDGAKNIYQNQLDYLTDGKGDLLVDFVGRFDRLPGDFRSVLERASAADIPLPHVNKSVHTSYRLYYTDITRQMVEDRYARDIDFFQFRF
jgi:hypothetical protein